MEPIVCPACSANNPGERESCTRCGGSLALPRIERMAAEMQTLTARMRHSDARGGKRFSTINGIGTALLDYRSKGDGTWSAVRWITVCFVPLIPLGGYVIEPIREEHTGDHVSATFHVVRRFPLSAKRILRTYLMVLAAFLPLVAGWINSSWLNRNVGSGKMFFVMLATIVWAAYVVFWRIKNDHGVYQPLAPLPRR